MRKVAAELALPFALFAAWWFVSADDTSPFWPPLSRIVTAFHSNWLFADVRPDLVPSLERIALGLVAGVIVGVTVGVAVGTSPWARRALEPLLECMRATPLAAILPVSILLLGIGLSQKVAVIAFVTTWPVLLNTAEGVRGIDPEVIETARVYGLGRRERLVHVTLPGALPQMFAGLRIALSLSLLAVVFAELYASHDGLGYFILNAQDSFRIADMWSGIFVLALFAYGLNVLFTVLERRALFWHRAAKASALRGSV